MTSSTSGATLRCHCGEQLPVTPRDAGQRLTCQCGRTIEVPAETPPELLATGAPLHVRRRRRSRGRSRAARPRGPSRLTRLRQRARTWRGEHRRAARRVRRAAWWYVGAAVVAAVLLWTVGERWVPTTLLLLGGRWVLLLPLIVLVPLAVALSPRALAPLGLAALMVLGPLMGFRLGLGRILGGSGGARLRVVTFDAGGGAVLSAHLDRALGRWRADVVALQGCGESLAQIVRTLPGWHHHETAGVCLLSRYPIDEVAVLGDGDPAPARAALGAADVAVRYVLRAPDGPVHLTTLHLDAERRGLEGYANFDFALLDPVGDAGDAPSRQARRWATAAPSPIVVGDFNLPVESHVYRRSWGDLGNAFSAAGIGFGHTRRARWLRVRIDHVLYGDGWRATGAWVAPDEGAAHRPLVTELVRTR